MNKKFFVYQENINDCGAACLTMILKLFNKKVSLKDIKKKIKIDKEGISAYDIVKISSKYKIIAKGYKNCNLDDITLPAIVHVINDNNLSHFMVLLKVFNNKVQVADPATNIRFISKSDFLKHYTKIAILFENKVIKKNYRYQIINSIKIVILTLLFSLLSILCSFLFSNILNFLHNYNNVKYLYTMLFWFLFISFLKEIFVHIRQKIALKYEFKTDYEITVDTLKNLISLPYSFYNQNGSGELISKINDLGYIKEMFYILVEELSINIILILCIEIILFILDVNLFLVSIFLVFIIYIVNKKFLKRNYSNIYDIQMKNEYINGNITDCIMGITTIKNLRKEEFFKDNLISTYKNYVGENKGLSISYQNKNFLVNIISLIFKFLITFILIAKKMGVYKIVFITSLFDTVISSTLEFCKVQMVYANYKSAKIRLKSLRLNNKFELSPKINIRNITFKNFYYKINDSFVFKSVNLCIESGQWILVCGKAGSGKTTLFKLLTKQISNYSKGIYINGIDVKKLSLDTILKSITYVDQKAKLFNKSIRENIYFDVKKEDKIIENYLKMEKINKDLIVDNANSNLSGGQIQKVIIAQTLLNSSEVIIFDETMSQIDIKEELKILKFIKKYYPNKTIILISHRKNNAFLFDKIVNFENKSVKIINKEVL